MHTPCIVVVLCKMQPDGDIYNGPEQGVQEGEQTAEGAVVLARSAFYTGDRVQGSGIPGRILSSPCWPFKYKKTNTPASAGTREGKEPQLFAVRDADPAA